jgi:RNA polymerase sigma-70 factor (ECF subfamily)
MMKAHVSETADDLADLTDEALLGRYRDEGRTADFNALVQRYERELYRYLARYMGDASLAEDVFQNTFLQVVKKLDQYEAGRPVKPWLYTIATNQAIDAMRRQSRHQAVSLNQTRQVGDGGQAAGDGELRSLLDNLESQQPAPEEAVEAEERREKVRAAVDRLPEFLRQVLVLAYYQGMKYREIADVLGIPVGTVKSRLHAALVKFHEVWTASPSFHEA